MAGYASGYSCYPILSSFISLFPFLLSGNLLTAQNVFTTLALLGVLHKPVTIVFAFEVRSLFQAMTTLERMELLLLVDNDGKSFRGSFAEGDGSVYSKLDFTDRPTKRTTGKLEKEPQCGGMPNANKEQSGSLHSNSDSSEECPNSFTLKNESQLPLSREELSPTSHGSHQGKPFLCFSEGKYYSWEQSHELFISNSQLIAITGPVGCGKTSLLYTIIGEILPTSGQIAYQGRIAYVSQTPWVFSGTIRQNILFGKEYNHSAFERVIEVCSLKEDLVAFPSGDNTHVGERGVSLSGGQRARINLARAVYSDADIYLLDDPLSALDIKVSKEIFHRCICDVLSDTIRVMITHDPFCLQKADLVLFVSKEGKMSEGTFKELCESGKFPDITGLKFTVTEDEGNFPNTPTAWLDQGIESGDPGGLETVNEDRMTGSVSYLTYWRYFKYGISKFLMILMMFLLLLPEGE